MVIKYLKPTTFKNKTVLLRVDVNVPIDGKTGKVADDFRIASIIPTIRMLQEGNNRIILCGHLGRPDGRDKNLSLRPVARVLAGHLGYKFLETHHPLPEYPISHLIFYTGNIMADLHAGQLQNISSKDIVMLENLRFYKGEEGNDKYFARCLARLGEAYINDAFSVCHRAAASTVAITKFLPSYCGPLLEQEIKSLDVVTHKHKKPFVLLMGGIKISDKAKAVISAVAPALGAALGGPLGGMAGQVISQAIGGNVAQLEKAILANDPQSIVKLREIEANFKQRCLELGIEEQEIALKFEAAAVDDRKSAREMAKINMWPQIFISVAFLVGYFGFLYLFFSGEITVSPDWKSEANILLGVLSVNIPIIMQFWFGSSSGSQRKTQLLARSQPIEE